MRRTEYKMTETKNLNNGIVSTETLKMKTDEFQLVCFK